MTEQEFIDKYCCTDSHAEYCNDDCDSCEREFKKDLELIKERIRADDIEECIEAINSWIERQKCFKDTLKYISTNLCEDLEKLKEQK